MAQPDDELPARRVRRKAPREVGDLPRKAAGMDGAASPVANEEWGPARRAPYAMLEATLEAEDTAGETDWHAILWSGVLTGMMYVSSFGYVCLCRSMSAGSCLGRSWSVSVVRGVPLRTRFHIQQ